MSKTQGRRINNTKWSVLARANAVGIKAETIVESDQESGHPRIDFKIILIHLLIVSLFAGLIYSPSVGFPFTFVDAYITGPFASKLRETNFWHELVLQSFLNPLYQPWLKASFAQDLSYSAASASSFRLINVGLHVVNCMLLYILTFRVHRHIYSESTQQKNPDQKVSLYLVAFLTSILFACHPLTSQSVAYIAGRGGVLTGLNILLALNFFLLGLWKNQAFPICTGYLGAAVFSLLAIETSPDGFAAPMLLLLATALLYTSVKEKKVSAERKWELAILSALTIFITIAATQLAAANEFSNNFGLIGLNPIAYLASQFRGFLFYYLRLRTISSRTIDRTSMVHRPQPFRPNRYPWNDGILRHSFSCLEKENSNFVIFCAERNFSCVLTIASNISNRLWFRRTLLFSARYDMRAVRHDSKSIVPTKPTHLYKCRGFICYVAERPNALARVGMEVDP